VTAERVPDNIHFAMLSETGSDKGVDESSGSLSRGTDIVSCRYIIWILSTSRPVDDLNYFYLKKWGLFANDVNNK
jgi:hypothetical protein